MISDLTGQKEVCVCVCAYVCVCVCRDGDTQERLGIGLFYSCLGWLGGQG